MLEKFVNVYSLHLCECVSNNVRTIKQAYQTSFYSFRLYYISLMLFAYVATCKATGDIAIWQLLQQKTICLMIIRLNKLRKPIIYEVLRFTNGLSSNLIMIERHTCYFELFSYMVHCYLIKKNFKRCLICYKDSLHEKLHTRSLLKKSQFNSLQ